MTVPWLQELHGACLQLVSARMHKAHKRATQGPCSARHALLCCVFLSQCKLLWHESSGNPVMASCSELLPSLELKDVRRGF